MKELVEAFYSRLRAPLVGNFFLGVLILNWNHFYLLLFSSKEASQRVSEFEQQFNVLTFALLPIVFALVFSLAQPFLSLFGAWTAYWPTHWKRLLQLRSDTDFEDRKQELELHRRKRIGEIEEQLIGQAERDQTVAEIEDDEARQKLQEQIDELRKNANTIQPATVTPSTKEPDWIKTLSPIALQILRQAARGGGEIAVQNLLSGKSIHVGGLSFGIPNEPRELAKAEAGISSLEKHALIRAQNADRSNFKLTEKGYDVADQLN